ncbi:MAG: HAD-IA family hydrolase [Lachnospiraceae bacterium]|nr:HAD-IA family hydrolase [Lachnospiraceae bacterium]
MKKYTTAIFDLDGTLLNTIDDLADSVNYTLKELQMPQRSLEEVLSYVGNGIQVLIHKAVPEHTSKEIEDKAFAVFREHYLANCEVKTAPYPGILELLDKLQQAGIKTAIVSNKNDVPVKKLNQTYFGNRIPVAIGEKEAKGIRKKPAPDTVFEAMKELGSKTEESIYIGDSEVDKETAINAGMPVILVSWGFRDREFLKALDPEYLVDTVKELENILV